jgi:hypothetical protein
MDVKVTYLQMFAPPRRAVPPPREGKYFLQWVIDLAWSYRPRRFWLHTCDLDHPAALPNYCKAGFEVYKEEMTVRGPYPA